MLNLGKIQKLKIAKVKDFGVYLTGGSTDAGGEENEAMVLLPKKQVPGGAGVGDEVEVFLYRDSQDRPIATTRKPLLQVGEIAQVVVKDVSGIGAFVDIGLEKDVLLPHREMRYAVKPGDRVEVYLYTDKSNRLAATMYTKKYEETAHRRDGAQVREYHYERDAEKVYKLLHETYQGHVPYTDKTVTPAQIEADFGMSKAAFKRAVGKLLKENRIKITKTSIFCIY